MLNRLSIFFPRFEARSLPGDVLGGVTAAVVGLVFGLLRLGQYVTYTPYSVISGFMTGVGVIVILVQTLPFLGAPVATGGPLESDSEFPQHHRAL